MSRYIDADAFEYQLKEIEAITAMSHIELGEEDDDIGEISMPMFTIRNIMKRCASIDIVRCKECKWWNTDGCCDGVGECEWAYYMTKPNDFCSYGSIGEREGE
ncbi:MAG: hypothetical protein IJH55_09375 [Romboutsia sp.]|nr:hypothetical protein [Romboutsia sp.]